MTRFTVIWHREAEGELVELWLSASDRNEISAAVQSIDVALSSDAKTKGESVAEGLRSFSAPPLRILFAVLNADRVVQIELVRRI